MSSDTIKPQIRDKNRKKNILNCIINNPYYCAHNIGIDLENTYPKKNFSPQSINEVISILKNDGIIRHFPRPEIPPNLQKKLKFKTNSKPIVLTEYGLCYCVRELFKNEKGEYSASLNDQIISDISNLISKNDFIFPTVLQNWESILKDKYVTDNISNAIEILSKQNPKNNHEGRIKLNFKDGIKSEDIWRKYCIFSIAKTCVSYLRECEQSIKLHKMDNYYFNETFDYNQKKIIGNLYDEIFEINSELGLEPDVFFADLFIGHLIDEPKPRLNDAEKTDLFKALSIAPLILQTGLNEDSPLYSLLKDYAGRKVVCYSKIVGLNKSILDN